MTLDCVNVIAGLVRVLIGGANRVQSKKEGLAEAQAEPYGNQKECGATAKLSEAEIAELQTIDGQSAQIDEAFPVVDKLREKLIESRAVLEDKREKLMHAAAEVVELVGKSRPEILV